MNLSTKLITVQAFPPISSSLCLGDFVSRLLWHFSHLSKVKLVIPLAPGIAVPLSLEVPSSFDPSIQRLVNSHLSRIEFIENCSINQASELLSSSDYVLKHIEGLAEIDKYVLDSRKPSFRVDPCKVRQEGSFYIQCAFECLKNKDILITESKRKFDQLVADLRGRSKSWVLATGPSLEQYSNHEYDNAVVIACNSTILNDGLMDLCKPSLLVFADPIFHFGVSQYAGRFRAAVEERMSDSNLRIVVPLKYYPLLLSKFPKYNDRIIGIPTTGNILHNFNIDESFVVKNTSNILTLLLLPLATTLSKDVHITGCDGRPLEQDDYFWGHAKTAQINDKMANIKEVHPGFFQIDYNEYYFEHCHTLSNFLDQAEDLGWQFCHHGHSHIPALRDRSADCTQSALALPPKSSATRCLILEPDGIGLDGHYVRWHNNLVTELQKEFEQVDLICNRKQDPSLYSCSAHPFFSNFSWSISRATHCFHRDFSTSESHQLFIKELIHAIESVYNPTPTELSVFIYYGSIHIVKALQSVRTKLLEVGVSLRVSVCLFHESVILDAARDEPRYPPGSRQILFEGAAQTDVFKLTCPTSSLSKYVYLQLGVSLPVFPNPPPSISDRDILNKLELSASNKVSSDMAENGTHTILLPTNQREEKGRYIIERLLDHLHTHGVPAGCRFLVRGEPPAGCIPARNLEYLGANISDYAYSEHLRLADIAVIPYLSPAFTYRTSGILPELLANLTSIIVLDGTWLADVVRDTGSGISITYRSPYSILSAIKVLSNKSSALDVIQERRTKIYLRQNSWQNAAGFAMH